MMLLHESEDFPCRKPGMVHQWMPVGAGIRRCKVCQHAYRPVGVGTCNLCGGTVYWFEHGYRDGKFPIRHASCREIARP